MSLELSQEQVLTSVKPGKSAKIILSILNSLEYGETLNYTQSDLIDQSGFTEDRVQSVIKKLSHLGYMKKITTRKKGKFQTKYLLLKDSDGNYLFEPIPFFYKNIVQTTGIVYLLKADNGIYKIGNTTDLENRLHQLNRELPYDLSIIHIIKSNDIESLELKFHEKFKENRIRNEWFKLTPKQVNEFISHEVI